MPSVVFAGGTPGVTEKDKALSLSAAAETLPPRPIAKMTTVRYEVPYRGTPVATPIRESLAQEKIQVIRSGGPTMQLHDKSELRYHYTAGSSLAMSARPHHFSSAGALASKNCAMGAS